VIGLIVVAAVAGGFAALHWAAPWFTERRLAASSLAELEKRAHATPDDPLVCWYYGRALLASGSPKEAAALFQRAADLAPRDVRPRIGLGQSMAALGRLEDAEHAYLKAIEVAPAALEPRMILAHLYREHSRPLTAVQTLEGAAQSHPENARVWYVLGHAYGDVNQRERARDALLKAAELDKSRAEYLRDLGRAHWHFDQLAEAEKALAGAVWLKPNDGLAQIWLGQVHARKPDSPENRRLAETALREGIRLEPNRAEGFVDLGLLMRRSEILEEAERLLREAVRLEPHSETALNELGRTLIRRGNRLEGDQFLAQAKRVGVEKRQVKALETALQQRPKDAPGHLKLARLYRRFRDPRAAFSAYVSYLALAPKDAAVAREVAEYQRELSPTRQR
jgi:Flp pilus assembly protein TadD